ncbi:MAG: CvpA family protein [Paludibacteraceae bacterium]|nr:CvpA family protein [Paludibacteraceae bacterium]
MNTIDIILLCVVGVSAVTGFSRGLVKELMGITAIIVGLIVTKLYSPAVAEWLIQDTGMSPFSARIVSYTALMLGIWILGQIVGRLLTRFFRALKLGWLNRLGGAGVSVLKYAIVASLVLNVLALVEPKIPIIRPEQKEASALYAPTLRLASVAWDKVIETGVYPIPMHDKE